MLIAAALAWMYGRTLAGLVVEWTSSPDASYGLVLAGAAAAVAWQRRKTFAAEIDRSASPWAPLALLVGGLSVYVVGLLAADVFLSRVSIVPVVAGIIGILCGGRALRVAAAPLAFALIAIPLPALVVNAITLPLQFGASRLAEASLMLVGVPVFRDGNLLELPSTTLEVAEACSGLRSLISLTAIAVLLAWALRANVPRRCALPILAVPIAVGMNGLRIAATGIACETWGPQMAVGGWHTFTGWLTFVASIMVLLQVWRRVSPAAPAAAVQPSFA